MAKLMLIDGNSLAYRAFFALPTSLALASGQVTNAVFGFTSMLINLLKDHTPDQIAVALDRPEPTFRHALVSDYKAGRAEAPDILRQQLGLVRQVVETLKIPIVEKAGFEADDVIATLATEARDRGDEVLVVTGDRDAYQLVEDPLVKVLYNMRGVTDYAIYDEAGIREKTGVTPADYPQYAALRGDPSDNLPGVPGRGPEDGGQADQHLRRPRRRLRQRRQEHAQAAGEPDRPRGAGPAQRHRHAAGARRPPRGRPRQPAHGPVGPRRRPGAVPLPGVQHPLPPVHRGDGRGGAGAGGQRAARRDGPPGRQPRGGDQGLPGRGEPGRVVGGRGGPQRPARGRRQRRRRRGVVGPLRPAPGRLRHATPPTRPRS